MLAGSMTIGTFVTYGLFLGLLVAHLSDRYDRDAVLGRNGGLERTAIFLTSREDDDPKRTRHRDVRGTWS